MDTVSIQQIESFTPTTAVKLVEEIGERVMSEKLRTKIIELEGEGYYMGMLDRLITISESVARYFDDRYWVSTSTRLSEDEVDAQTRGLIIGYYLLVEFIEHSIKRSDIESQNKYVDEKNIDYDTLIWIVISPSYNNNRDKMLN